MAPDLQNLVLVAGHAIPHDFSRLDEDAGWHLKPFQKGEGKYYVEHVRRGVELAAEDPASLLLFSGGQTDAAAGPVSEAQGYFRIAEHAGWFGHGCVRGRANTEEFALDSLLNLLYGLCRFYECTGRYPQRVTAVGWAFKESRFEFHREALRFPRDCFQYVGVNDPEALEEARHFEALRLADFREDPYGSSAALGAKRAQRNPFRRHPSYALSCPELRGLLEHSGREMFDGRLPWRE